MGGKVVDIIIDNGGFVNLIATKAITALKLKSQAHPSPYHISLIHNGGEVKILDQCVLKLSIGKMYEDDIICDIVDMDTAHIILGCPW